MIRAPAGERTVGTLMAQLRATMAKVVHCECGYVARGETDDELVADVQQHGHDVHNMDMTRE
jgi:hypothetical protein